MRQISRIDLLVICSFLCLASVLQAQQSSKTAPRQVQAQVPPNTRNQPAKPAAGSVPTAKAAPIPDKKPAAAAAPANADDESTTALDEILEKWEAASAKIKTIRGEQTRSEFNIPFEIEKVSKGSFYLEMPDRGRIDMMTVHVKEGTLSKKTNKEGHPFKVVSADQSDIWICNGEAILQLTEKKEDGERKAERTYHRVEIPVEQRGANIVNTPLPFLMGIKAEEAKSRFQLKLRAENKDAALIWVIPRLEKDRQNYKLASITIDKKKWLPTIVKMVDDTGLEIVYTFDSVVVNERKLLPPGWGTDPYRPNLKGYTLVVTNDDPVDVPLVKNDPKKSTLEIKPVNGQRRIPPANSASPNLGGAIRK